MVYYGHYNVLKRKLYAALLPLTKHCFSNNSLRKGHLLSFRASLFTSSRLNSLPVRMAVARQRAHADDIFKAAVASVLPHAMVTKALKRDGDRLTIGEKTYILKNNVHIVAFGKAVIGMVRAADDILSDHIVGGIASVPTSIRDTMKQLGKWELLPSATCNVRIMEGGENNLPDVNSHHAAMEIYDLLDYLNENDIVLALVSGGGSALLPSPVPPITLEELVYVTRLLAHNGATIQQLNTIRKHLELLKGGGLAKAAYPAKVVALLISDVVGNDLDFISSGPTVPDFTTPRQCLDLLETLGVLNKTPRSIVELLEMKANQPEFTKDIIGHGDSIDLEQVVQKNQPSFHCENVQNVIIGSNEIALEAAERVARDAGYFSFVLSSEVVGDAEEIGALFAQLAVYVCRNLRCGRGADQELVSAELQLVSHGIPKTVVTALRNVIEESAHVGRPICILAAGETTVHVHGSGVGGRCQQMALSAAVSMDQLMPASSDLKNEFAVVFLTAGTDGQDGPTDAAGAIVDPMFVERAARAPGPLTLQEARNNNDAYTFLTNFERGRNLLKTGLTGTNVMDIHILLIEHIKASANAFSNY